MSENLKIDSTLDNDEDFMFWDQSAQMENIMTRKMKKALILQFFLGLLNHSNPLYFVMALLQKCRSLSWQQAFKDASGLSELSKDDEGCQII